MKILRRRKVAEAPPEPRPRLVLRRILTTTGPTDDGECEPSGPVLEIERMGLTIVKLSSVRNKGSFYLVRGGVLQKYIKQSCTTARRADAPVGGAVMAGLRGSNYVWAHTEPVAVDVTEDVGVVVRGAGDLAYEADSVEFCQLRGRQRFWLNGFVWTRTGPQTAIMDGATAHLADFNPHWLVHRLVR